MIKRVTRVLLDPTVVLILGGALATVYLAPAIVKAINKALDMRGL